MDYEAELMRRAKAAMARLEVQPRVNCRVTGLVADPESVKPVENPKPAADPESATGVTLQPVDSTGKAT